MPSKDNAVTAYAQQILNQVRQVVVGKDQVLLWVLAAILARGHILLEDIPGVGKTTMALAFSRVLDLEYSRVQFTPDVLPSDVTGYSVPDPDGKGLRYQPGVTWINTKQRRIATNNDAPIFSLNHTAGLYNFGRADYAFNFTEAGIYKRFWLASWGKIDAYVKGGVQWNKVPFPLLIMPAANLSYIMEDYTFNLIDNMEFLNDRYASLMLSWDMNGKIFNRIPLLKKLKWREYIACNVLWGTLTKKNNPFLERNATDGRLLHFPGHFNADGSYTYTSHAMDYRKPYVEVIAGIHNIFKLFHIEYVRRLTYTDTPGVDKWGIRGMFRITF